MTSTTLTRASKDSDTLSALSHSPFSGKYGSVHRWHEWYFYSIRLSCPGDRRKEEKSRSQFPFYLKSDGKTNIYPFDPSENWVMTKHQITNPFFVHTQRLLLLSAPWRVLMLFRLFEGLATMQGAPGRFPDDLRHSRHFLLYPWKKGSTWGLSLVHWHPMDLLSLCGEAALPISTQPLLSVADFKAGEICQGRERLRQHWEQWPADVGD